MAEKELELHYTDEDLNILEEIEEKLVFPVFNSETALAVGLEIVGEAKKQHGEIAVTVTRASDHNEIFRYIMDAKAERNIGFAKAKANTVLETGHCSFHALVKGILEGKTTEDLFADPERLPVGGAFPIMVHGKLEGVVAVSGLHDGDDQRVLVNAIAGYLDVEIPEFTGVIL